jgi:hypothetical protein
VLSPQHKGAFPKQSAINLVVLFTYNIEAALARSKKVIMFILNMQKAFNTLLKR